MPPNSLRSLLRAHMVAVLGFGIVLVITVATTTVDLRGSGGQAAAKTRPVAMSAPSHARTDLLDRDPVKVVAAAPKRPVVVKHRPAARRAATHRKVHIVRWLPSGVGMWIYQWNHTGGGKAAAVVRAARSYGITTLYVRSGSTHDGFTGGAVLQTLLRATHGTNVRVVAWDFPELRNPVLDAHRLARAAHVIARGGRVAAVAPDIETAAEGTNSRAQSIRVYLQTLRALLPPNVAILTAVPWPSAFRVGHYPYGVVAGHSDALLPMAYWYNNSPVAVTAASMKFLKRYRRPVQPIGQGYDGTLDVPSLPHNNLAVQVPQFLRTARAYGATAVSLWSWQSAPVGTWRSLALAHQLFG